VFPGTDRQSSSSATNGGADASESDPLLVRMSSRCSAVFLQFPLPAIDCLTQYATHIFQAFVTSSAGDHLAAAAVGSPDYDGLFNHTGTWHDDLSLNDVHLSSNSAWCIERPPPPPPPPPATTSTSTASTPGSYPTIPTVTPAAIFGRIVSAISFVLSQCERDQSTMRDLEVNASISNILQLTFERFRPIYHWAVCKLAKAEALYNQGKQRNARRPQKTTVSTFSSNHVVLDLLRNQGTRTMFNASSFSNLTLVHVAASLCTLAQHSRNMKNNPQNNQQNRQNRQNQQEPHLPHVPHVQQAMLWHKHETLQIIGQAHWNSLRGEPALSCLRLSSLPVYFQTKMKAFQSTVLHSRGIIFAGRGGQTVRLFVCIVFHWIFIVFSLSFFVFFCLFLLLCFFFFRKKKSSSLHKHVFFLFLFLFLFHAPPHSPSTCPGGTRD
jgi:hypothetical protein